MQNMVFNYVFITFIFLYIAGFAFYVFNGIMKHLEENRNLRRLEIENKNPALIKKVQIALQEKYGFTQTINNQNKNKIARATIHKI